MVNDTCHICLETKEYNMEELMKECCRGFICNECWGDLINSPEINECPLCRRVMERNIVEIDRRRNLLTRNRVSNIRKMSMILKWNILGCIFTILPLLIIRWGDLEQIMDDMKFLSRYLYFWVITTCYGYLIVCIYETITNKVCQNWNE